MPRETTYVENLNKVPDYFEIFVNGLLIGKVLI